MEGGEQTFSDGGSELGIRSRRSSRCGSLQSVIGEGSPGNLGDVHGSAVTGRKVSCYQRCPVKSPVLRFHLWSVERRRRPSTLGFTKLSIDSAKADSAVLRSLFIPL